MALTQLVDQGDKVNIRAFVWVQGESDAKTEEHAKNYETLLISILKHLRETVCQDSELPVLLGVDEAHPWVVKHPQVVEAQQNIAATDSTVAYTTMKGLQKADSTHLTPKGLEEHGKRMFKAYLSLVKATPASTQINP